MQPHSAHTGRANLNLCIGRKRRSACFERLPLVVHQWEEILCRSIDWLSHKLACIGGKRALGRATVKSAPGTRAIQGRPTGD
jgi:hypothetical protein